MKIKTLYTKENQNPICQGKSKYNPYVKIKNKPTIYQKNKTPTIYNTMIKNRYPLYQNIKYPNTQTQKTILTYTHTVK